MKTHPSPRRERARSKPSQAGSGEDLNGIASNDAAEVDGPNQVRRTLHVIERLAMGPLSIDQLAQSMGVHQRTTLRMLRVLEQEGWVESDDGESARFKLTPKILGTAGTLLGRISVVQASVPFVRALRDELDETSHIAVPSQGFAVQVYEEPSSHPLAVTIPLGSRVPLHASAIGKALAAHLPSVAEMATHEGLTKFTPNTITTRDGFERELAITRSRGFAIDDEELNPGTRCVAAPVRNPFGVVIAALGASGPQVRMSRDRTEVVVAAVLEQAQALSEALGWRPVKNVDAEGAVPGEPDPSGRIV